jgi:hypothetical protein
MIPKTSVSRAFSRLPVIKYDGATPCLVRAGAPSIPKAPINGSEGKKPMIPIVSFSGLDHSCNGKTPSQARGSSPVLQNAYFPTYEETNSIHTFDPLLGSLVSDEATPHRVRLTHISRAPVLTPAMISTYDLGPEMDIARLLQRRPDPTRFSSMMLPEYGDQTMHQADLDASALPRFQGQDQHLQSQNAFSKFTHFFRP